MAIDAEGIGGPPRRLARFAPPALSGARRTLPGDALAGLTLAAIALPGSMGTAQLVGAPAIAGLIAFIVGSVVFALLVGHRTLSVGADSSIAPLLAAAAAGGAITGVATTGQLTESGHPVIHPETLMLTSAERRGAVQPVPAQQAVPSSNTVSPKPEANATSNF